jgi:hypothetical protein
MDSSFPVSHIWEEFRTWWNEFCSVLGEVLYVFSIYAPVVVILMTLIAIPVFSIIWFLDRKLDL